MQNNLKTLKTIMLISFIGIWSCNSINDEVDLNQDLHQEEKKLELPFNVSIHDNLFDFKKEADFNSAFDYFNNFKYDELKSWHNEVNFKSMLELKTVSQQRNNQEEDDDEYDELLLSLLNENGAVIIEGKIFKLDFDEKLVYVYNNMDEYYSKLDNEIYSFDEEVLAIVFGEDYDSEARISFCSGQNTNWKTLWSNSPDGKVEYRLRYLNAGIYYSLTATLKKANNGNVYLHVGTSGENFARNKKRCNGNNLEVWQQGYQKSRKIRTYYNTRRLQAYRLNAQFFALPDGSPGSSTMQNISCNESNKCG